MSTTQAVNCLTANSNQCTKNNFNETVPLCSAIADQSACEHSYGCYYANNACKEIDADYCTQSSVLNSIVLCRKDQNDFCYFNNGQCSVCNSKVGPKEDMKLISMDGTRCMDKSIGCQPYFQRNDHAACRKYCEFTEQPNFTTYTCDDCEKSSKYVAIDGVCMNTEECKNGPQGTYRQGMLSIYTKLLNNTYKSRMSCTLNVSKSSNYEITILDGKFSSKIQYEEVPGNERKSRCPQNYEKVDYWPLEAGESGPRLTGPEEGMYAKVNQIISSRCVCPAGFYIDSDENCLQCPGATTSYNVDSKSCEEVCTGVIQADGSCGEGCGPFEMVESQGEVRKCVACKPGHLQVAGKCQPVPKSYFLRIKPNSANSRMKNGRLEVGMLYSVQSGQVQVSQFLERCKNGKTTAEAGSYSEAQCSESCSTGQFIDPQGQCVNSCPAGTTANGSYCEVCQLGQQLVNDQCQNCPQGTYKSYFEVECTKCPGKTTTANDGATDASACTVSCPGVVLTNGNCGLNCGEGEAAIGGRCTLCGSGKYVSASGDSCVTECPAGEQLETTQDPKKCQACPDGTSKPNAGNGSCTQCNSNEVSMGGITCRTCDGIQVPVNNVCTDCAQDKFVNSDQTQCVDSCPAGQVAVSQKCTACSAGTYKDQNQCKDCPAGQVAQPGSSTCTSCQNAQAPSSDKSVCEACTGSTPYLSLDKTQCVGACQNGEQPVNNICQKCPKGTASSNGQTCTACTGTQYSDELGASSCKTCPSGANGTQSQGATGNDGCNNSCQPGFHKNDSGTCVQCPAGTHSTSGVECTFCTGLGYAGAGSSQCSNCQDDNIPMPDHTSCVLCNQLIQEQADGSYKCQPKCNSGYGTVENSKLCQKCPTGHKIQDSKCIPCPAMTFYNEKTNQCEKCPANGYSGEKAIQCQLCENSTPLVNVQGNGCVASCGPSLMILGSRCVTCPSGKVSSEANNTQCTTCQPMTFATKGNTKCEACPAGAWSAAGQTLCTECRNHYVSADKNECVTHCPAGQLTNEVTKQCEKCPAGQYVVDGTCRECGDNYQVTVDGLGCTKCPNSTISNEKTGFKCSLCENGFVMSLDGKKCQKQCSRNEQPVSVNIKLDKNSDAFVSGMQCEKCQIGYQSINGEQCIFVQDSYQQAIDDARNQSSKKILIIVMPIILLLLIIGVVLTVIFVRKMKQKNALKSVQNAYGKQKMVATSLMQSRRQVDSVI